MFRAIEVTNTSGRRVLIRAKAITHLIQLDRTVEIHLTNDHIVYVTEPMDALLTKIEYAENPR